MDSNDAFVPGVIVGALFGAVITALLLLTFLRGDLERGACFAIDGEYVSEVEMCRVGDSLVPVPTNED